MADNRLQTVDVLRGFAAIAVCLFHFTGSGLPKVEMPATEAAFSWGYLGVEVFFVISGFIIPYVLLRGQYAARDAGEFLFRRAVRLMPPAWAAMVLTLLLSTGVELLFGRDWLSDFSVPALIANMTFVVPLTPYQWFDGVFWTLAVELQFYVVLAAAFPLAFGSRRGFAIYALAAAISCIAFRGVVQIQLLGYAPLFAMGGACLMLRTKKFGYAGFAAAIAALFAIASYGIGLMEAIFGASTALVIALVPFNFPTANFLGRISYSLYLTHMVVGPTVEGLAAKVVPLNNPVAKSAVLCLCLAAAVGFAWVFNIAVEQPAVRLAHRINLRRPTVQGVPQ